MLSGSTSLNKALDVDTFGVLATAVAARLGSVGSVAITGEQRLNSVKDEITVDKLTAHFKARFNASLPSTGLPTATQRINGTRESLTLDHVVAYLKNTAGISIAIPVNSVAPVISGTGSGPFTVSNNGTWSNSPDSYTYQWQKAGVDIPGATTNTLAQSGTYVGQSMRCVVKAVNEAGTSLGANSNAIVGA